MNTTLGVFAGLRHTPGSENVSETLEYAFECTKQTIDKVGDAVDYAADSVIHVVIGPGGELVYKIARSAAARASSVLASVWRNLRRNHKYWLSSGTFVIFVGTAAAVALVRSQQIGSGENSLRNMIPVGARSQGKRYKRTLGPDGEIRVDAFDGLSLQPLDFINDGDLYYSKELVNELRLFTAFKVRDNNLLLQVTSRAAQWIKNLGDSYSVPNSSRYRLIYGSVAMAMDVTSEEKDSTEFLLQRDVFGVTKAWLTPAIPNRYSWKDVVFGCNPIAAASNWIARGIACNTAFGVPRA